MTYDPRPFRNTRDARDPRDVRDNRDPRDSRDARDGRDNRDDRAAASNAADPRLRELLVFLRDSCREIATRLDRYLLDERPLRAAAMSDRNQERSFAPVTPRAPKTSSGDSNEVRERLERLREESRTMSDDANSMEPAKLRLLIEAITAETRAFQARAEDSEEQDLAAKILRTLTAVVSEHRPGHVYGLARHHSADWIDVSRRAREDLAAGNYHRARPEDAAGRAVTEEVIDEEPV